MAHIYVDSTATGGGATGADWANAYLTLAAAVDDGAGNDVWVAHNHAESTAGAVAITSAGTLGNPVKIHCVTSAGSVPPVAADLRTTATVTSTGANSITLGGVAYCYGITFSGGSGAVTAGIGQGTSASSWVLESCGLAAPGTTGPFVITGSSSASSAAYSLQLLNCTVTFGAVAGSIFLRGGRFQMLGGSIAATGFIPTNLFTYSTCQQPTSVRLSGVDLSTFSTGKTLIPALSLPIPIIFEGCKLHLSTPPTLAATPTVHGGRANLLRCSGSDVHYDDNLYTYFGTKTVETTIVRTGGASDGTTPIAHKFITGANTSRFNPFVGDPIVFWNETVGSITITLQGIWGGAAVPTNAEIWFEVEYPDTSGTPHFSRASSGPATTLTTPTNTSAGSGTWGGSVGSNTKFAMAVTISPEEKGPIMLRIHCGKASETDGFFIDPKPIIT